MVCRVNMGKFVPNSEQSYEVLKEITDRYFSHKLTIQNAFLLIRELFLIYVGSFRRDDGVDPKITISFPTSCTAIVAGVRYIKSSGRQTEDHFLFRPNTNLYKCKGKELAKICPEYTGAHELQLQTITQ